jgi:DNA-directed RNA polymerase subunit RPC12/RpoP
MANSIRCPHCSRQTLREANVAEVRALRRYLVEEWSHVDENEIEEYPNGDIVFVVCPECGFMDFVTVPYGIEDTYPIVKRVIKRVAKRDGK